MTDNDNRPTCERCGGPGPLLAKNDLCGPCDLDRTKVARGAFIDLSQFGPCRACVHEGNDQWPVQAVLLGDGGEVAGFLRECGHWSAWRGAMATTGLNS